MNSDTKLHAQDALYDIGALLTAANRLIRESAVFGKVGVGEDIENASRVISTAIERAHALCDELDEPDDLPLRRAA